MAEKMKSEKFTNFTDRCLGLGRNFGWEKEIKAKEEVAWEVHEEFPPTGSLLLSHLILDQGRSYIRSDIGTKEFAKRLAVDSFQAVDHIEDKDGWDYYYLGLSQQYGRGTSQSYALAAESFSAACEAGNPYAQFEAIWSRYLAGGPRMEAVLSLTDLRGKLADFAAYSARALMLLELGPVRDVGSPSHILRILLLKRAMHNFIYHDQGARQIRIAIEKEFRDGVTELQMMDTSRSNLALYLIACISRSNPTGSDSIHWFQKAIDPELDELQMLCRQQFFSFDELRMIVEHAETNGWSDAQLAILAKSEIECDDY